MSRIEMINQLSGVIIGTQDKIESLTYKIKELEKPGSVCDAELHLEINRNRRSSSRHRITKSYVLMMLKDEVSELALKLVEFEKQYKAIL